MQMTRRMETMRLTKPQQAADTTLDDDEPAAASTADLKSNSAGVSRPRNRMQSPRRVARKAPKTEELTKSEKERLGIIKKQRCAVCERVYELENLPVPPHASRPEATPRTAKLRTPPADPTRGRDAGGCFVPCGGKAQGEVGVGFWRQAYQGPAVCGAEQAVRSSAADQHRSLHFP